MTSGAGASSPFYATPLLREVAGGCLRPGGAELTRRALGLMALPAGARLLDVGCGLGVSAGLAAREFSLRVAALDPSLGFLRDAASGHLAASGASLLQGRAEALPLADASQDGILCECVLSVTVDPEAALDEITRVLRPGGLLALSDLCLKNGPTPPASTGAAARPTTTGCAAGAVPVRLTLDRLRRRGLLPEVVEDHARLLAELAARLVFAGLPSTALCGGCAEGGRPGYVLVLARKEDSR